jgi:DNA-binding transcriptional regulator YiaG
VTIDLQVGNTGHNVLKPRLTFNKRRGMHDFDLGCLTPAEPLAPEAIRHIREQSHMSQATFALALNVSTILVSKWERGEVCPSGP